MKNQKGITLIALVITIIVLLILAGISIAMLAGDNGVLTKASDSKIVNAIGAKKDEVALVAAEALSDYYESIYVNETKAEYDNGNLVDAIVAKINDATRGVKSDADVNVTCDKTNGVKITSKAKSDLYTEGKFDTSTGGLTWTDHFKK